jgi:hypothetical protein
MVESTVKRQREMGAIGKKGKRARNAEIGPSRDIARDQQRVRASLICRQMNTRSD